MPFNTNVFVNCPFDNDYKVLLKPLLFTIQYLGYTPKISETQSSSDIRIHKIIKHIKDSKFGIHDISRCKPLKHGDLPRFNMPYELGIDIGSLSFGSRSHRSKKILILETERFHYQKVLSDIGGQDIKHHNDDPKAMVRSVRDWFSSVSKGKDQPSTSTIWNAYNQSTAEIEEQLTDKGFSAADISEMSVGEYIKFTKRWIKSFKTG